MNVKIITRHAPSNYGSLLQSIASIKVLENMGHDVCIIDYQSRNFTGFHKVWADACRKSGNIFKRVLYIFVRYPIEKFAAIRFDWMRKRYLKMTSRMYKQTELNKLRADVFMTGSDQVWRPMPDGLLDTTYFLDFTEIGKKVSYASSFGMDRFDESIVFEYKRLLSRFDKITVREDTAVRMLENWDLKNCVGQVIDPTLLLEKSEWLNMFSMRDSVDMGYVLVYQIHNSPIVGRFAKTLAEKKKLKLLRVSPFFHQVMREGKFVCCPDVKRFLNLINGANYIVTDSFHGTCFAIVFNKQFVEILPNDATGTRNQSLLTLTGLTSRIVNDYTDCKLVDTKIDYTLINVLLNEERKKCKRVLSCLVSGESYD